MEGKPEEFDENIGVQFGYYVITGVAGRNEYHQQRYIGACLCCGREFTKVLSGFKRAAGKHSCPHRKGNERPRVAPHPCKNCGELTQNPDFCTLGCKTAFNNRNRKKVRLCEVCGSEVHGKRKFCSDSCTERARIKRIMERVGELHGEK